MKTRKNLCKKVSQLFLCAFMLLSLSVATCAASPATLKDTYGKLFGRMGTSINLYELQNPSILSHVKSQYNSITLENEMKPDAMLGYSPSLISIDEAKRLGYYIPSGYTETYVPRINFDKVDATLKICSENGIGVRAHTLVWHSQTPDWFFRVGFSKNYGYVSPDTMDKRMEFYIKTIMNHVYSGPYGKCVYTWDVVNEYLHATPSGWEAIYGKCGTRPPFVKKAFEYAYDCLKYYGLTNSVSLLYNDFNTYMEVNDVISLINYINSNGKICSGVGMQSHLSTKYPSVDYYTAALKAFVNAGFEVQITELDVVNTSDEDQATYLYNLMKNILNVKKAGGKITGISYWGISDEITWIKGEKPLLFSRLGEPKLAYYEVLRAYTDIMSGDSSNQNPNPPTNTGALSDGWYYIKNVNAQKYLQVANNAGGNGINVEIGTGTGVNGQKWYLTNTGDGYVTLKNRQGFMLDVAYGSKDDGANIQTYSANNADAQKFKLTNVGPSTFGILTKVSNDQKALDVYNFGTSDGANVCQWAYYTNKNQQWVFEPCN